MKKLLQLTLVSLGVCTLLSAADHVIDQKGKAFSPTKLTISVGDTITFKNSDPFAHNAFTDDEANEFDIGMQSSNTDKTITIKKAGTFNIECAIHPNMLLEVIAK